MPMLLLMLTRIRVSVPMLMSESEWRATLSALREDGLNAVQVGTTHKYEYKYTYKYEY